MATNSDFISKSTKSTITSNNLKCVNIIINVINILEIINQTKKDFENGYWLQADNIIKNEPELFIKELNRCTSYHPEEKNHTFTHVLYIPSLGYTLINFLNKKCASQFIYEKQGVYWANGAIKDEEELDSEEDEENEETEDGNEINCEERKIGYQIFKGEYKGEDKGEEEDEDEDEEEDDDDEDDDEDDTEKEAYEPIKESIKEEREKKIINEYAGCEIKKININAEKFLKVIRKKLKKVEINKSYYIFVFNDTENTEKYFESVTFNLKK